MAITQCRQHISRSQPSQHTMGVPPRWVIISIRSVQSGIQIQDDCNRPPNRFSQFAAPGNVKLIWMRYYGDKNERTLETVSVASILCLYTEPNKWIMEKWREHQPAATLDEVVVSAHPFIVRCALLPIAHVRIGSHILQGALNKLCRPVPRVFQVCFNFIVAIRVGWFKYLFK